MEIILLIANTYQHLQINNSYDHLHQKGIIIVNTNNSNKVFALLVAKLLYKR